MEISAFDIATSCRTCLLTSSNLESLFETFFENLPLSKILNLINPSLKIDQDDKLSHQICEDCRTNAINAYKFQQMCSSNDKRIRTLIESEMKFVVDVVESIKTEETGSEVNHQDDLNILAKIEGSLDISMQSNNSNDVMLTEMKPIEEDFESETPDMSNEDSDSMSSSASDDDNKNEKYSCDSCNKQFTSNRKLDSHMKNTHQKSKSAGSEDESSDDDDDTMKTFTCDLCPKMFKKPSLLARHIKTHDPNKRPHECPKCQKRFPSQVALVRHDILHSELVERSKIPRHEAQTFSCVICGRCFKSYESLSSHLKSHKSKTSDEDEYACKLCLDVFPTFSDITRHSKNHIENATHQCAICNKLFVVGDELIDHFLRHKGLKPHQCPVCEKSFLKLHKLNVHMRIHSDDKVSQRIFRRWRRLTSFIFQLNSFLCPECGKSLSTNENLKRHLIRHTGIKVDRYYLVPTSNNRFL